MGSQASGAVDQRNNQVGSASFSWAYILGCEPIMGPAELSQLLSCIGFTAVGLRDPWYNEEHRSISRLHNSLERIRWSDCALQEVYNEDELMMALPKHENNVEVAIPDNHDVIENMLYSATKPLHWVLHSVDG
ncbi:hypothetical protein AMATHDRAFT_48962 [Amanita thiersii Skay4041]|uniref:Uncharacterized protein n=1 Tax=Amanita thiersii Skay4041 TaxID=703135 RepID=A0A2A9NN83_9AGAR|nr:hypothetical protein AMATHDRAFT_48962 [Amanita thiersii Skay4041]